MNSDPVGTAPAGWRSGVRFGIARPQGTHALGWVGAALLLTVLAMAFLAPILSGHDPQVTSGRPFEAPGAGHLLGTDDIGRDIAAQLFYGARISLAIGLFSAIGAILLGLIVALIAGYWQGVTERVLMRLVDLTLAFPFLPLVIVLAAFLGRGLLVTVLVIGAVLWARPARVLRAQVLKVREFQHVAAARAMGAHPAYVMLRHVLPRILPLAVAQFVRSANVAVLLEASLAFLGLGDLTQDSWGTMLYYASSHSAILTGTWLWWILPPGLLLAVTILGLALVGYRLEEWADPRLASMPAPRVAIPPPVTAPTNETMVRTPPTSQSAGETILVIQDLRVWYDTPTGAARAVDGVDLTIRRGRVVGLVGESGCGKSTLAMTILGLDLPAARLVSGTVEFKGAAIRPSSGGRIAELRGREIALIPQSAMNSLNPMYSVYTQVLEAARMTRTGPSAAAHTHELLDLVGLPAERHDAYPHELSGGMRQRAIIAMAISNEPALLIADEPVTGLDVVTQGQILRLLLGLRQRFGMAILLISHDLPMIGRLADDLVVMYAGRIVESAAASRVIGAARHPYTNALLRAFPDVHGPRRRGGSITGEPPDLIAPPPGCRFHPRCPSAFEACSTVEPPLFEPVLGHYSACLLEERDNANPRRPERN